MFNKDFERIIRVLSITAITCCKLFTHSSIRMSAIVADSIKAGNQILDEIKEKK